MSRDFYSVLGVTRDAPDIVIRAAYKALNQKFHPDRNSDSDAARHARDVNEAYATLSDPERKARYDAQLGAAVVPPPAKEAQHARQAAPIVVHGAVDGREFDLRFTPGRVIANDTWQETVVKSEGGGGITAAGYGYSRAAKIKTQSVPKQRIAIRTHGLDRFVEPASGQIPVAVGQDVELVALTGGNTRGSPQVVAVVNRSSGQWHWVLSQIDAGKLVRTGAAQFVDFLFYVAFVVLASAAVWALFVKGSGFFVWAAFVVLGVPALIGAGVPFLFRSARKAGSSIREAIATGASRAANA